MRKGTFVGVMVVALAMILTAGGLLASNMGFKLNYQLKAAGSTLPEGGTSLTGLNTIALPYNTQTGLVLASHVRTDMGAANVQNLQKFQESSDSYVLYTGAKGSTDWVLTSGEGYFAKMALDLNYIVVGSHNPTFGVSLEPAGVNGSLTGLNLFAYPYHSTAASASALRTEIGAANVQSIQKFQRASDSYLLYTGAKGSTDFTLNPGEAYFIKMGGAVAINFVPSHY